MASSVIPSQNSIETWETDSLHAVRVGKIVWISYLSLTAGVASGQVYTLTTLPERFRPMYQCCIPWVGTNSNNPVSTGRIDIDATTGVITWVGSTYSAMQELSFSTCYVAQ